MKARVLSPALAEISEAALWFDSRRDGLGAEFWHELDSVLTRIEENLLGFGRSEFATPELDIRFAIVRRFNYVIHFLVEPDEVQIISVAHGGAPAGLLVAAYQEVRSFTPPLSWKLRVVLINRLGPLGSS